MVQSGTITRPNTSDGPGELLSKFKRYPFLSDDQWEVGDTVQFDLEEMELNGEVTHVAVNLRRLILDIGVGNPEIQMLEFEGEFPHNTGKLHDPPIGISGGRRMVVISNRNCIIDEDTVDNNSSFTQNCTVYYNIGNSVFVSPYGSLTVVEFLSDDITYHHTSH